MAQSPLLNLPPEIMDEIAVHSDFFTQLYLGSMPCICEYHRWIDHEEMKGRGSLRNTVFLCKFTIRTWYNRKRQQLRKSDTIFGYWKKKFKTVKWDDLIIVSHQTELIAMWKGFAEYMKYASIRDWKQEGILMMCIDYNLQALNRTPFQANLRLQRRCHMECFQEAIVRYTFRLFSTPFEDFERKKNF